MMDLSTSVYIHSIMILLFIFILSAQFKYVSDLSYRKFENPNSSFFCSVK